MQAVRSPDEIREVNTRYHDVAAASYDSKWGIDFGEIGQGQVLGKSGILNLDCVIPSLSRDHF